MSDPADFGTEKNGKRNNDYCAYCYMEGDFTDDSTMEEMIQKCAEFSDSFRDEAGKSYTKEEAIEKMREYFPMLKRWAK